MLVISITNFQQKLKRNDTFREIQQSLYTKISTLTNILPISYQNISLCSDDHRALHDFLLHDLRYIIFPSFEVHNGAHNFKIRSRFEDELENEAKIPDYSNRENVVYLPPENCKQEPNAHQGSNYNGEGSDQELIFGDELGVRFQRVGVLPVQTAGVLGAHTAAGAWDEIAQRQQYRSEDEHSYVKSYYYI
ncbi:Hypothetical_protein [Hexamita inflata]|uniref:Hypothetical_protein n=1 Tax=Hexamita inflata TaxID=28002 RepID=A0AA86NZ56_9EUKA|nr:Hypothetical protein HINF_LOCUS16146 [Hexamita inflata]